MSELSSPSADKLSAPTRERATAETDGTTNEVGHFEPNRSTRSAVVSNRERGGGGRRGGPFDVVVGSR